MSEPVTDSKIMIKLNKYFHKIFSPSHFAYTIFFFIEVLILIVFYFLGSTTLGNIGLFLATTFSLTFIFLMLIGISSKFESYLFSKSLDQYKTMIFIITLGVSFVIVLLYFLFGHSDQIDNSIEFIKFIGWDYILPGFYIIVYFGWNIAQIFFLKTSFEDIAFKANDKIVSDSNSNRNKYFSIIFLILAISISILTQLGTYFAFISFFEPQTSTDSSLIWFNGWNIAMYGVIFLISYRLVFLNIKSIKNNTPNIYSSIFFVLVYLIIWYRSFSFINSFRSVSSALVAGIDAFRAFIDIVLMIITAILVIKGLGSKTFKFRIFNPNNLAFFLFAFTLIYIEGQIVMITGAGSISGTYTNRNQVNLVNNFAVLLITIIFYWFYSEYSLKKNGLILKQNFNQKEVIEIVTDFKSHLINSGALDSEKINDWEFQNFLKNKKLFIEEEERESEYNSPEESTNNQSDI